MQVSYAIGVAKPMNVTVYTEGTGKISDDQIAELVNEHFDLRPKGIIQMLDLLRPIYARRRRTATSAATSPSSPGKRPTRSRCCAKPRACAKLPLPRTDSSSAADRTGLFDPLCLRELTLPNRIVVSPMCQYSAVDGCATDWHFVHWGQLLMSGAGLFTIEATAVTGDGRITPDVWVSTTTRAKRR